MFGPECQQGRVGVVTIAVDGYDSQELATLLDSAYRIQTRAGLHCAPLLHQAIGTSASGGALRFSLGYFNTAAQIDCVIQAVGEIAATAAV
jgi:selenocysteine lyase/cysteine desulfurase